MHAAVPADARSDVLAGALAGYRSVQSAEPDGHWDRIVDSREAGRGLPIANTFMNGDLRNGPHTHGTHCAFPIVDDLILSASVDSG